MASEARKKLLFFLFSPCKLNRFLTGFWWHKLFDVYVKKCEICNENLIRLKQDCNAVTILNWNNTDKNTFILKCRILQTYRKESFKLSNEWSCMLLIQTLFILWLCWKQIMIDVKKITQPLIELAIHLQVSYQMLFHLNLQQPKGMHFCSAFNEL